jgi:hypothetical protein
MRASSKLKKILEKYKDVNLSINDKTGWNAIVYDNEYNMSDFEATSFHELITKIYATIIKKEKGNA